MELKTRGEIDAMREAGRLVAGVLTAVERHAAVGVTPAELDDLAAQLVADAGATPSFLHYHPHFAPTPYPAVICASVNDAIVHGIPDRTPLRDGDLLSVDFAAHVDGWCADSALTTIVGTPDPADVALVDTARRALDAGIAQLRPGRRMGDVANAVGTVARRGGYGLLQGYGGHGVGRAMHEPPHVPNEGTARRGLKLTAGLVVAVEPMLTRGGDHHVIDADGWTIRTADRSRAAHVEHTIAITADGPLVLTARD